MQNGAKSRQAEASPPSSPPVAPVQDARWSAAQRVVEFNRDNRRKIKSLWILLSIGLTVFGMIGIIWKTFWFPFVGAVILALDCWYFIGVHRRAMIHVIPLEDARRED